MWMIWTGFRRRLSWLVLAGIIGVSLLMADFSKAAEGNSEPTWATPGATALRKVSPVGTSQVSPNFLNNLDCNLVDYRLVGSTTMQQGCFTPTAFGLLDADSDNVIYNGTDETLPLLPYVPQEVLVPWPGALDLVALDGLATGGSYISLYKNPVSAAQDQRNYLGQLTAKRLIVPPELHLLDQAGQRLVINPQTLAFSAGGSWLVAEATNGYFVRVNLATLEVAAFAPSFGSQGNPGLLTSHVAVSDDGRYIAINNEAANSLKVYDLAVCQWPVGVKQASCPSHDYRGFVSSQISGLQRVAHLRFVNNGLLSFEATATSQAGNGIYELAPAASIAFLTNYIGLGDSYSSGEGAFDYLPLTDTNDNMCHLSRHSYPLLLTQDLFSAAGGHSVACSGAVINDVGSKSADYRGQRRDGASLQQLQQNNPSLLASVMANYLPGYVAQHLFVKQYLPQVVTASVGGDDIGFGDLVQNCVEPHISRHYSDSTCYDTYEARLELKQLIDRTVPRWTALYKQLQSESPGARVYAIGYPEIVMDTGNCALNVHLNKSEMEFAEEIIDYLNSDIRQAAAKANVVYADISQALAGHRLCETSSANVAVNGLTAGKDAGILGINVFAHESYHPNILGQSLIEQAILKQTHNLTAAIASAVTGSSGQQLLAKPKTGRAIHAVMPVKSIVPATVRRGSSTKLSVDGIKVGLKPKSKYIVKLDGSTGSPVADLTSDETGSLAGQVPIPATIEPGGHTIDVTGPGQTDQPIDVTQPIYVTESDTDSDGDGIPDVTDGCPAAVNSGQDVNHDGIDDACDGLIGLPPTTEHAGGSSGSGTGGDDSSPPSLGTSSENSGSTLQPATRLLTGVSLQPAKLSSTASLHVRRLSVSGQALLGAKTVITKQGGPNQASLNFGGHAANPTSNPRLQLPTTKSESHVFPSLKIIPWWRWCYLLVLMLLLIFVVIWLVKKFYTNQPAIRLQ